MIDLPDSFDNDDYNHNMQHIKHVVEIRFQWEEADEYLTPNKTGWVWYLGSLVDEIRGGRLSRLEGLPDTWFIGPYIDSETRYRCVWYHE